MKAEIPEFILEMSKQMTEQPNRSTSHPYWQVRCKKYVVTAEGYNEHHWVLVDEDGEFFRSDIQTDEEMRELFWERHEEFCEEFIASREESFDSFDIEYDDLPNNVTKVYVQEVEEVVSTHFTEHDAKWFINRTQHNHSPLYTYVESAYWSPQIKQLQDWIISLTESRGNEQ